MKYECMGCGKDFEMELSSARKIQCPFCGYRIITKPRQGVPLRVDAV